MPDPRAASATRRPRAAGTLRRGGPHRRPTGSRRACAPPLERGRAHVHLDHAHSRDHQRAPRPRSGPREDRRGRTDDAICASFLRCRSGQGVALSLRASCPGPGSAVRSWRGRPCAAPPAPPRTGRWRAMSAPPRRHRWGRASWCGAPGCRARRRRAAEDRRERLAQRRRHDHVLLLARGQVGRGRRRAVEDDDALDLRQLRGRRLQVQRLHVEQRVLDGHREQVAEDHRGALLAPQRALGRDGRVLVDGRLHLRRAVDVEAGRELEAHRLAVVGRSDCAPSQAIMLARPLGT